MISLCNDWQFTSQWSESFMRGEGSGEPVRLPHNVKELPQHYAGPEDYEGVWGYRRKLEIPESCRGKKLFLQFDGAAHQAWVYVNGRFAGEHHCGYTAFRLDITELMNWNGENMVAVKLDSREDGNIPPFGFVIDYLTYGGLYREAWLDVREQSYIEDIFVATPDLSTARVRMKVQGGFDKLRLSILDGEKLLLSALDGTDQRLSLPQAEPWDIFTPKLYTLRAELLDKDGKILDTQEVSFGFRTAEFKADGFYLNGEKTFLRGLNRHQSYPYIGYAAPEALQREDARILKEELKCTAVRTSHYPQSQYFIDECDRLGLPVFTELPGWQHIGDEKWKEQAVENVREMILQYRNHPSIILWGVRINESVDDDEFYRRTNALAHELDGSRCTSGVRYLEKSSLLEDVYSYNDFSHNGLTPGAKRKKDVTPDMDKALIISEHNGHMFPTKSFDPWEKRQEQALRHARVQSAAAGSGEHAGCFGWCMFDYATHKDFGSGDRICYHGVLDSFRNPKLAAAVYASQGDEPVLELGCPMDIGDYAAGNVGKVYAFTNAEEVALYKNDVYVTSFTKREQEGLRCGPVLIDDTIGELLKTQEGFPHREAELLRRCLISAGRHGLANMPAADKARMLWCMLRYRLTMADGVRLYGKYVGNWGGEATRWRFEGKIGGKTVISQTRCPGKQLHIELRCSHTRLKEGYSYDMAAVRVRILDEFGNTASYAQLPLNFEVTGALKLVGPALATAEGGMSGCYVKTRGEAGKAGLKVSAPGLEAAELEFEVEV